MTPPPPPQTPKPKSTDSSPGLGYQGKSVPTPPTDPSLSSFERARLFLESFKGLGGFDTGVLRSDIRLVSAVLHPKGSPGPLCTCVFALTVTPSMCNRVGTLHGGAAATLIDILSTIALALIARPGYWEYAGVSRNLNVTYLRPAPLGMKVRIVAEVVQAGKTVCSLRARVEDEKTGEWLSIGEHCKTVRSSGNKVEAKL